MASNPDFVQYIADQCAGAGEITVADTSTFDPFIDCFYYLCSRIAKQIIRNYEESKDYHPQDDAQ